MNKFFTRIVGAALGLAMAIGVGVSFGSSKSFTEPAVIYAAEGDTHDFTQSLSQLLNNGADINDITISAPSYTIKQVIITYQHNKSLSGDFVTASCKIGGNSFGSSAELTANASAGTTASFSGTAVSGAVVISFDNHRTGTKQGTLQVTNVRLVEGPAPHVNVSSVSVTPNSATLLPGGTYNLADHVTVLPDNASDKSVTYEITDSEPSGCATVSESGLITAIKDGIAEVTVTSVDDGTKTAVFTVGIETPSEPTIALNKSSLNGYVGGSDSLTADFVSLEGTGVSWTQTSSDGGLVTLGTPDVSVAGKSTVAVTYSAAGTVVVKAKDNGGNTFDECTIIISERLNAVYEKIVETETASWAVPDKSAFGSNETEEGISDTFNDDQGHTWTYVRKLVSGSAYTGSALNNGYIQLGKDGGVDNLTLSTTISSKVTKVSVNCASYQNAHNVSITVGGDTYLASTSVPRWSNNTGDIKSGTGTSSGEIIIRFTDGSRALYIKSISVEYDVETTGANIANSDVIAQKTVIDFAKDFDTDLKAVCIAYGTTSTSSLTSTWNSLAEKFDNWFNNGAKSLSEDEISNAKALFANASSLDKEEDPSADYLQHMLAKYDWILNHYDLSDFLADDEGTSRTPVSGARLIRPMNAVFDNQNNIVAVIVVISVVSLVALGGFLFISKRKQR